MSRFYLTLPSNSSRYYYPQNYAAQYTTKLNSLIDLDGEWEVGLTEISSFEIENVLEGECYFHLSVIAEDLDSLKITLPAGHCRRFEELSANLQAAQLLQIPVKSGNKAPVEFSFTKNQN